MGAAPVPIFVRSLALDSPDICPQFFLGNFSRQEREKTTNRQDGLQNGDPIERPPSNKRSPFRISTPFKCVLLISAPILILYKSTGTYQPRFISRWSVARAFPPATS